MGLLKFKLKYTTSLNKSLKSILDAGYILSFDTVMGGMYIFLNLGGTA